MATPAENLENQFGHYTEDMMPILWESTRVAELFTIRLRLERELERGRLRAESGGGDGDAETEDKNNL